MLRRVHVVGLAVAALGVLHARANDSSPSVVFAPSHKHAVVNTILPELAAAQSTIDVAQYLFSDQDLADALVAAKKRGVQVRVIVDKGQAKLKSSRDEYLAYNGIPVHRMGVGTAMGAKFHHKFAVIDDATVVTGSMNWSEDTEAWNYENVIILRDDAIAKAYSKEFDSLFTKGWGNVGSTQDVLFCPTGNAQSLEKRIGAEMGDAKKEIVASIYLFTSWDIEAALVAALGRGVKVSVLVDAQQAGYGESLLYDLRKHGARLKLVKLHGSGILAEKFHDKYAVIDGQTVITGSFNWAPNQDRYGWDNLVVLHDATLAKNYLGDFAAIWSSPVAH
jgi:cardiolipin hydrolase